MLKTVEVEIEGTSALLMHQYPLEQIEALDKKTPAEQAEASAYRDPHNGELYVPGVNLQRALVSAAVYSKGKGRASLQKLVAACALVAPERLMLGRKEFAIDTRAVVIRATKGRVLRHRARLDSWKLRFALEFDDTLLNATQMRRVVDDAGTRVGLLDFRPETKGPFGRFMVVQWRLRE